VPSIRSGSAWRPDGTIKYAENPPKKYQDIYPFDFESRATGRRCGTSCKRRVRFWIAQGVRIFRVDNPHTKPFAFWEWLIARGQARAPRRDLPRRGVHAPEGDAPLAKLGFTQSYTYFTWRNTKQELTEYFTELTQTGPRVLPAELLAEHARHPARVPAARRPPGVPGCGSCSRRRSAPNYGIYGPASSSARTCRASRAARSTSTRRSTRSSTGISSARTACASSSRGERDPPRAHPALQSRLEPLPSTRPTTPAQLWYKDAIIYQLHVKAFFDSNNDGIGDFAGLTEKLDYLQDLGVTALWLLPFYPSPGRDDGYDIADYGDINPDYGTMKDFRASCARRSARPARHHRARHQPHLRPAPGSSARARKPGSKSERAQLLRLERHRPEIPGHADHLHRHREVELDLGPGGRAVLLAPLLLAPARPQLRQSARARALVQVMRAGSTPASTASGSTPSPTSVEREGTNNENLPETHAVIKKIRAELDAYAKGKHAAGRSQPVAGGRAGIFRRRRRMPHGLPLPADAAHLHGDRAGGPLPDHRHPAQTPDIPDNCQWAMFLRNHDELTLEMVTDVERDYLWSTYANDPRARINLGIRRRLAPLMDNDRRKIELMNSLLLSLPGTPIIYYGDEIGMGDNIYLGDRNGVRTPMQWTPDRNGGFSRADPARLYAAADHGPGLRL
jgi:glycosidase